MFGVLSASMTAGLGLLGAYCFSRFASEGAKHVAVLAQLKAKRGAYAPPLERSLRVKGRQLPAWQRRE